MTLITVVLFLLGWAISATAGLLFFYGKARKFQRLSMLDPLTGLLNRRGFNEQAMKYLREVVADKEGWGKKRFFRINNFALIIFDIDDFKRLNKENGYRGGDAALRSFARILEGMVRPIDIVGRLGGEEFIVGLPGGSEKDALRVADRIRRWVQSAQFYWGGKKVRFTVSAGVVSSDDVGNVGNVRDLFDELYRLADDTLSRAKSEGKNRVIRNSVRRLT